MTVNTLSPQKVRHPIKIRMLEVLKTEWLTPYIKSITLTGENLDDFISESFEDHVKLYFPPSGKIKPSLPQLNPNGSLDTSGMKDGTIVRDFTPRRFNTLKKEVEFQFFIHHDRPASTWAVQAQPGDFIGMSGPKKSLIIPTEFDWYLMLGDETAIPALGRFLDELSTERSVTVVIETDQPAPSSLFKSAKNFHIQWVNKSLNPTSLHDYIAQWSIPSGEGFVWGAGEYAIMRALYSELINTKKIDKSRMRISSYWEKGEANSHGSFGK